MAQDVLVLALGPTVWSGPRRRAPPLPRMCRALAACPTPATVHPTRAALQADPDVPHCPGSPAGWTRGEGGQSEASTQGWRAGDEGGWVLPGSCRPSTAAAPHSPLLTVGCPSPGPSPVNGPSTLVSSIGPSKRVSVSCRNTHSHGRWENVKTESVPHPLLLALPPHGQDE